MSDSTDGLVRRQQPGDHTDEQRSHANQQKNSHALVPREGSVAHLDKDVDDHPNGDTDPKDGDRNYNEGPGTTHEGLVRGDSRDENEVAGGDFVGRFNFPLLLSYVSLVYGSAVVRPVVVVVIVD